MESYTQKQCKIIVVEGKDGSGKATQSNLLYQVINHTGKVKKFSFPNYESQSSYGVNEVLGERIHNFDNSIRNVATMSFALDRALSLYKKDSDILNAITNPGVVLFDRYTTSNILHQASMFNTYKEIDDYMSFIQYIEYDLLKLPKPDAVIYLDIPVEQSLINIKNRGNVTDAHETYEHLSKVDKFSSYIIEKMGWIKVECYDYEKKKMLCPLEIHIKICTILNSSPNLHFRGNIRAKTVL